MRNLVRSAAVLVVALVVLMPSAAPAPETRFPPDLPAILAKMPAGAKLELGLLKDGSIESIEFHVPFAQLPEEIRAALDRLLPGGEVLDAEIEHDASGVGYEVTKRIDGLEAELLVDAAGKARSWELQVLEAKVPAAVVKAAAGAAGGKVTQWEEIRDAAKVVVAYHVKKDEDGLRWKIAITPAGVVEYVRRELEAEVEATVR